MRFELKLVVLSFAIHGSCATAGPEDSQGLAGDASLPQADGANALPDAALADAGLIDAAMVDAAAPDLVVPDAALPDAAVPDTVLPVCGNGVPEGLELCDDNNTTAGDGCAADCLSAGPILFDDFEAGSNVGWTLIDADGHTPDDTVDFMSGAWVVAADGINTSPANRVVVSTSYYNPTGVADDWLISPALALDAHSVLTWRAYAPDADYRDGYEVRISTTTPDVAGMSANPVLLSVSQELTSWQNRSIDLAAAGYANQTVYISFRNNTNNKFLLFVDSVIVE
jgi:cysteine-rich repeat protein